METAPTTTEPELVALAPAITAVISATVPMAALNALFDRGVTTTAATLAEQAIVPVTES